MIPAYLSQSFLSPLASLSPLWASAARELCNHLWQSTLFAAIVALLALALRSYQARARYWLWLAASAKFLIPFSLLIALGSHLAWTHPSTPSQTATYLAIDQMSQPFTDTPGLNAPPIIAAPPVSHYPAALLPALLTALWFCGFLTVLTSCLVQWRRMCALVRSATPLHEGRELETLRRLEATNRGEAVIPAKAESPYLPLLRPTRPIQILTSHNSMEPGVFGIFRPVLLWPAAISPHLDDAHLEAVLAHELCHVQRRDNLTSILHMFVEAIFWFHPLVWWMERRLVDERERACDEAVVHLCHRPQVYAESILKVCELCIESPLTCVSGITGADLKKRIVQIMRDNNIARSLGLAPKCLLALAALIAIAIPVFLGAQASHNTPGNPPIEDDWAKAAGGTQQFDVASIRPSKSGKPSASIPMGAGNINWPSNGIVTAQNLTLIDYLEFAYKMADYQEESLKASAPAWIATDRFNIEARTENRNPTRDQLRLMMRSLLADRFKLAVHYETRQVNVYALQLVKPGALGPKLRANAPNSCASSVTPKTEPQTTKGDFPVICGGILGLPASAQDRYSFGASGLPMPIIARAFSSWGHLGRPVIDGTNLPGTYDFVLDFTPDPRPTYATVDSGGPTFQQALKEQLGLKLEPEKGPVEFLVLDHIERPVSQDQTESVAPTPSQPAPVASPSVAPTVLRVAQATTKPTEPTTPAPLVFEVSTVKLNNSGDTGSHTGMPGGMYTATNVLLKTLMQYSAYGIPQPRILGGPKWLDSQRFDIEAKLDPATLDRLKALPRDQRTPAMHAMFQQLLADRFHLIVHWETRDLPVYNLVVASKNGPTLPAAKDPDHGGGTSAGTGQLQCVGCTLAEIAQVLTQEAQGELSRVVVDKTGLAGKYDIRLKWSPDTDPSAPAPSGPSIFTAIQEQLGLKLEPGRGPVQVLVIDQVEMPTEN